MLNGESPRYRKLANEQFCGCWPTYPTCKEDCYWYKEWQDMGGHIPHCRFKKAVSIEPKDCENCQQYHSKYKPTRADKIRKMSDEKLAQLFVQISLWRKPAIYDTVSGFCLDDGVVKEKEWLDWLKQEAEKACFMRTMQIPNSRLGKGRRWMEVSVYNG